MLGTDGPWPTLGAIAQRCGSWSDPTWPNWTRFVAEAAKAGDDDKRADRGRIRTAGLWQRRRGAGVQIKHLPAASLLTNVVGLDWQRLASMYVRTRSADDCRIQWIGIDHPMIDHSDFSEYVRCMRPPQEGSGH